MATNADVTTKREHILYLDGIRGFAAVYVAMDHIWSLCKPPGFVWLDHGHMAVVVFIVLSGYSLMLPVSQKGQKQLPDLRGFAIRRARRILPPYYAALLLSMALIFLDPFFKSTTLQTGLYAPYPPRAEIVGAVISHLLLVHNWCGAWIYRINAPMWTVATEWQIYFLFPFVLLPVRKLFGNAALVVAGLSFTLLALIPGLGWCCPWFVGGFALGMLASELSESGYHSKPVLLVVAVGALALMAIAKHLLPLTSVTLAIITDTLLACITLSILVYARGASRNIFVRFFASKPMVTLGHFSYSIYLVHMPLIMVLAEFLKQRNHMLRFELMTLCLLPMLVVIYGFHLIFERPFMRWKRAI